MTPAEATTTVLCAIRRRLGAIPVDDTILRHSMRRRPKVSALVLLYSFTPKSFCYDRGSRVANQSGGSGSSQLKLSGVSVANELWRRCCRSASVLCIFNF